MPERIEGVEGPVVSEGRGDYGELIMSLMLLAFVAYGLPYQLNGLLTGEIDRIDIVLSIMLISLFTPLLVVGILGLKIGIAEVWRTRVVLDVDRVRAMRHERVLGEIVFDERTKIEVTPRGKYSFEHRFFHLSFDGGEEALPVLEAAAWKHRIVLKDNIANRLISEEG